MSVLGEYVHLNSWTYEAFGVGRNYKNKKAPRYSIIAAHKRLYQKIISQKVNVDLAEMQKAYNKNSEKEFNALKELCKDPKVKLELVKKLIEGADGISNRLLNDSNTLQRLADAIEFDDSKLNIKLNTQKTLSSKAFGQLTGTQWRETSALIRRAKAIVEASRNSTNPNMQQINFQANNILQQLNDFYQANTAKQSFQLPTWSSLPIQTGHRFTGKAVAVAQLIAQELESLRAALAITSSESALQAAFAEIFGPIIGSAAASFAEEVCSENILNWLQNYFGAGQQSVQTRSPNGMYIKLHSETLKDLVKISEKKKIYRGMLIQDPSTGYYVGFSTSVGGRQDQKIDTILNFQGRDFNASVKNIDLSQDYSYSGSEKDKGLIHLQGTVDGNSGTSLLQFLIGLNDFEADLGNHVLNILARHIDRPESSWIKMQRPAVISLLTTQMMWSALTGQYQGKIMPSAEILEIHDKAKDGSDRIKLYDMTQIFRAARENNGIIITPDIISLTQQANLLKNDYVKGLAKPSVQKRLTLLLLDARTRRFNMGLKKDIVRNLTKNNSDII